MIKFEDMVNVYLEVSTAVTYFIVVSDLWGKYVWLCFPETSLTIVMIHIKVVWICGQLEYPRTDVVCQITWYYSNVFMCELT
jgi:hypothetical protein